MTRARNSANLASHGNLFVDIANDRTGIGSVVPGQNLHVAGTAGFHADTTFTGDLYNTTWDRSENSLVFNDNAKAAFGNGSKATIRHSGSQLFINNNQGNLYLRVGDENGVLIVPNSEVKLYYNGTQTFETKNYGVNVTGTTDTDGLVVSGVATVTTMNVTGVLTYDDVTSIDSIGIITARSNIDCNGNLDVAGTSEFTGAATFSEPLTLSKDGDVVINFSANSGDNRGIYFNSRAALSADYNDGYLRLNNASQFANGVYTPLVMRADGGFRVDSHTVVNSSGFIVASRIAGALPAIDGSNLTGITQTTINNNANNRIITGSGTANTLEAEANLTFDGTTLYTVGDYMVKDPSTASYITHTFASNFAKIDIRGTNIANSNHYLIGYGAGHSEANDLHFVNTVGDLVLRTTQERIRITSDGKIGIGNIASPVNNVEIRTDAHGEGVTIKSTGNTSNALTFDANRGAGGVLGVVYGRWNGTTVAQMSFISGQDGTNKNDGYITFNTESDASNGNVNATERLRITADGKMGLNHTAPPAQFVVRAPGGSGHCSSQVHSGDSSTIMNMQAVQGVEGRFGMNTNHALCFYTNGLQHLKMLASGALQHTATSGVSYFKGSSEYVFGSDSSSPPSGGGEGNFQVHSHKTRVTLSINGYMNNAGAPILQFVSSRSGTPGTLGTKAALNDYHGDIRFMGDNGTNNNTLVNSAQILVRQKSTISDGDTVCAGEMSFYTGTDSAGSMLERLRIDSGGRLTLVNSEGIKLSAKTSTLYTQDGSLSYYATNNAVYLNGAGSGGWLRLNAAGTANDRTSINLTGHTASNGDSINFRTNSTERMKIDNNGHVNIGGAAGTTAGNLHVGVDGATGNFTDSGNGNTKHIEIGATSGGDALLTTHASGYGVAYFGYEAGGDRCIIACDDGGGGNKIDFVTNAGTSSGGSTDNLNGKLPKMRIKSGGGGVQIFVHESSTDFQPKDHATALLIQNGHGGGDIGPTSEPTHIDWHWVDSNTNVTPQCRISGNVGNGGDPNSLQLEGKGFLTFHCSDTAGTSGDHDPGQRLRIAHNGTFTGSSSNNISDQRLKENIATITDPIAKIKALKGRTFTWKTEASMREGTHYGFIAQEIETVIPELIVQDTGIRIFDKDDNLLPNNVYTPPVGGGYAKSVDADGVIPVLVEALKESLTRIETLEAEVAALKSA